MWLTPVHDPWLLLKEAAEQAAAAHLPPTRSYPRSLPLFQQNWHFPPNFRQSYRGLYQYLPRLFQAAHHWRVPIEHASSYFASMSEDVAERGSFPGLSERNLLQSYYNLINVLQYYQHHRDVSSYIRQQLSRSLVEFGPSRGRGSWNQYSYKAPQLFRAYAEISGQTMSRPLGHVLNDFFQSHHYSILADNVQDLAIWAHAIWRSYMREVDKYDCLALIVRYCPDLVLELRRLRIPAAEELWPVLADIANRLGISANRYRSRSRGRPLAARRGRSPVPRKIGWGSDARSLSRSRSRDSLVSLIGYPGSAGNMITRPLTAPGSGSIIRQADRVIELADDTADEAQILREMAKR